MIYDWTQPDEALRSIEKDCEIAERDREEEKHQDD